MTLTEVNTGLQVKNNGSVIQGSERSIDVLGSSKQVRKQTGGPTLIFVGPTLDFRRYLDAAGGASGSSVSDAIRTANVTALQAAIDDAHASTNGTRRVVIPGDSGTIYEFNAGVTLNSGVIITTEHPHALGPVLRFYGGAAEHFFTGTSSQSYFVAQGVRFEDKRANAATTGDCFSLPSSFNGHIFEGCLFQGFRRHIHFNAGDVLRISDCWLAWAYESSVYLQSPQNNIVIEMCQCVLSNANASGQAQSIYVTGGGSSETLTIRDIKCEGDVSTADMIVLNGSVPATLVQNVGFRGGVSGVRDIVRITGVASDGIGEQVTLRNISGLGGRAANLLRLIPSDGGGTEYTIPQHASNDAQIIHWSKSHRELSKYVRPEYPNSHSPSWSWAVSSSGTVAGTLVYGIGAGTSPSIAVYGDDESGTVEVTTGSSPTGGQIVFTMHFRVPWPRIPQSVTITPAGPNAAALSGNAAVYAGAASDTRLSRTFWRLYVGSTALAAATTYKWHYRVSP